MCFSATASFVASAAIGSGGILTLTKVKKRSQLMFGLIPVIFAVHQFIEGIVWITAPGTESGMANYIATTMYIFIAYTFWPIYLPLSLFLLETNAIRKKILAAVSCVGIIFSLYIAINLIKNGYSSAISCCDHLRYLVQVPYETIVRWIYGALLWIALLFGCSSKIFTMYGFLMIFSYLASYFWFKETFESVWCFFAAILSISIYIFFRYQDRLSK